MIYIQRVVSFLSPSLGEGIENTQRVGYKSYQTTTHGRFFLSHVAPSPSLHLCFLSTLHSVAMSLVRNITSTHKERVLQQYTNKSCLRRIFFNCWIKLNKVEHIFTILTFHPLIILLYHCFVSSQSVESVCLYTNDVNFTYVCDVTIGVGKHSVIIRIYVKSNIHGIKE